MRTLSRRLVVMFLLAVVAVVVVVDTVLLTVIALMNHPKGAMPSLPDHTWLITHPGSVMLCTLLVLGVIAISSMYKIESLRGGGAVVARAAGGERVANATSDPQLRQLLNVVEEIAIASSMPVPAVYVLSHEAGINAFAAGYNASNAAITVTQGCMDLLTRTELQGVIAHEFSHIVNGDIRLNARLTGLLFGLIVIGVIGRTILQFAPNNGINDRKNSGGLAVVIFITGAAIFVAGYVGLFFARIIQAAVARKRESLADAAAVQFTRDPTGLRNALVKIGAAPNGSQLPVSDADELAHMLFAPGMEQMFATHPSLIERIKAIDPRFDESEFATVRSELLTAKPRVESKVETSDAQRLQQMLATAVGINAMQVAQSVGQPTTDHIALAQAIRYSLPQNILDATGSPRDALGLMLALAMDNDAPLREQEINFIAHQLGTDTAQNCREWLVTVDQLNALQRQPALLRLLPSLRQLSTEQRAAILLCLNGLLQRGGNISPTKYALRKLAQVQLRDVAINSPLPQRLSLPAVVNEVAILMSVLAHNGTDDPQQAQRAYQAGMQFLYGRITVPYQPPANWAMQLDVALNKLDRLLSIEKEKLIETMVRVVAYDNKLIATEAELLRVTCATLHCPLPLMLGENDGVVTS